MWGTGTSTAQDPKAPVKVGEELNAHECGCVWLPADGWMSPDEAAQGARVTQATRGSVPSRFYPMGNEALLKDFKQWCDLLIFLFWKALPSAHRMVHQEATGWPPQDLSAWEGQAVPSCPEDGLSCFLHFASVSR